MYEVPAVDSSRKLRYCERRYISRIKYTAQDARAKSPDYILIRSKVTVLSCDGELSAGSFIAGLPASMLRLARAIKNA